MNIIDIILETYPELTLEDLTHRNGIIVQDDSDGQGAYIAKWEYSKPIPEGLTLGKP